MFDAKKDGSLRFAVEDRKLNAVKTLDLYPLSRMTKFIHSLGKTTVFSTRGTRSEYRQINIEECDRDRSAFTSHHVFDRLTRMPFGSKNGRITFQRAIDVMLDSVRWHLALAYLNDIFVFSKSPGEPMEQVRFKLQLFQEARVTLKLKQSNIFSETMDYRVMLCGLYDSSLQTILRTSSPNSSPPLYRPNFDRSWVCVM